MKKLTISSVFILCISLMAPIFGAEFTIFHTNDLHSYFDGVLKKEEGEIIRKGNYARLATAIKTSRSQAMESGDDFTVLVDAGDFYSGTLFHAIAPRKDRSEFPEYEYFMGLDYDMVTLGNHEFDAGMEGFDTMMEKVRTLGATVPIISTNFNIHEKHQDVILTSLIKDYSTSEGNLRLGFLGALGPDGCKVSAAYRDQYSFVGFDDEKSKDKWRKLYKRLKKEAKALRAQGAQVIILSIHGGGEEDEKIAKKVKDIDVIIAGHTHESYLKKVGDTLVAQAGYYGQQLGVLPFSFQNGKLTFKGKLNNLSHKILITEEMKEDAEVKAKMESYQKSVNQILLDQNLPESTDFIFSLDEDLPKHSEKENALGSFLTSKVLDSVKDEDDSIDVYFTTTGLIRTGLYSGVQYDSAELFKVLPLGFGENFSIGTPVVSFYLTKKEFKNMVDFLYLYAKVDDKYMPVFSRSMQVSFRKWGVPFLNKIKELKINGVSYDELPELIHVSTNEFIFKNVRFVKDKTFGLLNFTPKDEMGQEVESVPYYESEFKHFIQN